MMQKTINIDFRLPQVMTILNVTPDSFYAGSRMPQPSDTESCVRAAVADGCNIIDVGGYSSRPGADDVSSDEEWRRVEQGIGAVRRIAPTMAVSVDTFRSEVAVRAIETFGEVIINDITAGEADAEMFAVVAHYDVPYVAMHMRGTPATMQGMTEYGDIVQEVTSYLLERVALMQAAGVKRIILDPGFGFAKTLEQNYALLKGLHHICELGYPVLAGLSRKSMIYKLLNTTPDCALAGTIALDWECLRQGATILRVHDTREAVDTIRLFNQFQG
ncbi:MAG: dihydropteroate synthase [Alistipes sp.]